MFKRIREIRSAIGIPSRADGLISLTALACISLTAAGCRKPLRQPSPTVRQRKDELLARTLIEFDQARLYKPNEAGITGAAFNLAPLIMQENAPVSEGAAGSLFEGIPPTVYTTTSSSVLGGVPHEQVTYRWSCPHLAPIEGKEGLTVRWIRMTLGQDGFPLVWEVGDDTASANMLFLSEPLETAGREVFGGPLPGRRFSVERSIDETPETVVMGMVKDGPIPMGPYIYLASDGCAVTTVLCRCSPSQVNDIIESLYYDLEPMDRIHDWTAPPVLLTALLRWPQGL